MPNRGYKMKGPSLYRANGFGAQGDIKNKKDGYGGVADGRAKSSAVQMLGDLDKDGKMSGYEQARQNAIEKNTKPAAPKMYGKKSMAKKYKSDAQRKAVHASKAEKGSMAKMYGKKSAVKNYKKGYYGA